MEGVTLTKNKAAAIIYVSPDMEQLAKDDPTLAASLHSQLVQRNLDAVERDLPGRTIVQIEHGPLEFGTGTSKLQDGTDVEMSYVRMVSEVWHSG